MDCDVAMEAPRAGTGESGLAARPAAGAALSRRYGTLARGEDTVLRIGGAVRSGLISWRSISVILRQGVNRQTE